MAVLTSGYRCLQHVQDHARLAVLAEARNRLAGLGVEREQERPAGRVDDAVGVGRRRGCGRRSLRGRRRRCRFGDVVGPQQMAVGGVDRVHAAARIGHIHHAVDDDRRRLVADAVDDAVLKEPARRQRLHVRRLDLIRGREPAAGQIEIVERPVRSRRGVRPLGDNGGSEPDDDRSRRDVHQRKRWFWLHRL